MTLLQLQYFQVLSHNLHYTRTAEQLCISQPSLSYAINELEKELGVKLFQKENRKVTQTVYGQQFLPYVEQALTLLQDGSNVLRQMANNCPPDCPIRIFSQRFRLHDPRSGGRILSAGGKPPDSLSFFP